MGKRLTSTVFGRGVGGLGVAAAAAAASVAAMVAIQPYMPPTPQYRPSLVQIVPTGWYDWADRADRPVLPPQAAEAFRKTGTWTGARCLCKAGFEATYDRDRTHFVVTKAPDGYEDTLGKPFAAKPRQCLNCAD